MNINKLFYCNNLTILTILGKLVLDVLVGATGPASNGGRLVLFGVGALCLCENEEILSSGLPNDEASPEFPKTINSVQVQNSSANWCQLC
jgi:hypothetical protein